ncbi:capsule biosynthesis protein [Halodurantibacterium flavum]|uniref:Capsule biosynthesis protein n=1 Tax=Halodurantibacterium flavum TaxID=1382802 RepID=A0ABW4S8C7_9RHOB
MLEAMPFEAVSPASWDQRVFLMLQGPHGPFFHQLGKSLRAAGATVWRIGFNNGDQVFWPDRDSFIAFQGAPEDWPAFYGHVLAEQNVTDIVLYGDTRPVHAQAVAIARRLGLTVHVFEEGYLRPHWVTYERNGTNGNSRLMSLDVPEMRAAVNDLELEMPAAPARWGDMREHVFYGALYHFCVMAGGRRFRNFRPHRSIPIAQEFSLYLRRLLAMPIHALERFRESRAIQRGGFPYHLCLLQLEHDSSFRMHSPFSTMTEFVELCISGFAQGAPRHHHLVFKAHPLEDGRVPLKSEIRRLAQEYGVADRVHFVRGGKLAMLLNLTRSVITVNSTAAQQALWRGLPLRAFGKAVYDKPEFVSTQPLPEFFAHPTRPDTRAYHDYRHYLLETSQVTGGFYSVRGRRTLLRQVVDMMLAPQDPYDALQSGNAAPRQQLLLAS